MADNVANEFRRPVPIALAVIALIGWVLALYFWSARAATERELTAELQTEQSAHAETRAALANLEETAGAREELEALVEALRSERDTLGEERAAVEAELESLRAERAELQGEIDARTAELERVEAELAPLTEELGTFDERRAAAEAAVVAATQELAAVGERLEAARAEEAELIATLSSLREEAAELTEAAAEAEGRLQEAREAEASLETRLAAAREEFAQIEAERAGLEAHVQELTERRDALIADNEAARGQREALQTQIAELAEIVAVRSDEILRYEQRLGELQAEDAAIDRAVAAGLRPGQYAMGPISARFNADGSFEMADAEARERVTGRYAVEEGALTLYDVEGDTRWVEFPVRCAIEPEATGFSLHDEDGSCGVFSGQLFERAS